MNLNVPPQFIAMSWNVSPEGTGAGFDGAVTGDIVGAGIGAPSSKTSIPFIWGFCVFRTKSMVMAPSVTKVDTVTT